MNGLNEADILLLNQHQGIAPLVLFILAVDRTFAQFGERPDGRPYNSFRSALGDLCEEANLPEEADRKFKNLRKAFSRRTVNNYSIEELIHDLERILE